VYRITPHSSDDDDRTYRSREEVEEYKRGDCLLRTRTAFEQEGILKAKDLEEMEAKAKQIIDEAVKYAEEAPYPDVEEGSYPVYAEDIRPRSGEKEAQHA
jgi:2-oxoisovalerate dehydrogenase E1 component alpha subunit